MSLKKTSPDYTAFLSYFLLNRRCGTLKSQDLNELNKAISTYIQQGDFKNALLYAQTGCSQYGLEGLFLLCSVMLKKIKLDKANNEIIDQQLAKLIAFCEFIGKHSDKNQKFIKMKIQSLKLCSPKHINEIIKLSNEQAISLEESFKNFIDESKK